MGTFSKRESTGKKADELHFFFLMNARSAVKLLGLLAESKMHCRRNPHPFQAVSEALSEQRFCAPHRMEFTSTSLCDECWCVYCFKRPQIFCILSVTQVLPLDKREGITVGEGKLHSSVWCFIHEKWLIKCSQGVFNPVQPKRQDVSLCFSNLSSWNLLLHCYKG